MNYQSKTKKAKNKKIFLWIISFLVILTILVSPFAVSANDNNKDIVNDSNNDIKFKHITIKDGLTHHETLFVFQDSSGFIWFGTKNGLNRYNGLNINSFFHDPNPSNVNSLTGNFTHWIQEDKKGALWIATWGSGISKYDPKLNQFTNYSHDNKNPDSIGSNNVWSLFIDSKGFVWNGTANGISVLNPKTNTFAHYRHDPDNLNSLSNNTVSRIIEDDQGIFWISTYGGGLDRFNPETKNFTNYKNRQNNPNSLSSNNLWGVNIDSKKRIWIASEKGLNRFDPETEIFVSYQHDNLKPDSISSNTVTFIHEDHTGQLWLGTFGGGLNRFDPDLETFIRYQHDSQNPYSLSNDIVMSIFEDDTGAIWVSTYGGIDKYDSGEFQFDVYRNNPDSSNDLNNSMVRSIYADSDGSAWIGTGGGGLNQLNKERTSFTHYQHDPENPNSLSDNNIWAITKDKRGDFWLATNEGGLNKFSSDTKTFVRYKHDSKKINSLASDSLYDLAYDEKRDVLWIAAYLTGLDKFDIKTKTFKHYNFTGKQDGIVSNWVTAVFVDSDGLIWIGTEAGLSQFNPETEVFTNFKHVMENPNSLSANMIQAIYEDNQKNIWIGSNNGLNRYDKKTQFFERIIEKDFQVGNYIAGIIDDDAGNLWISTNNGLLKYNYEKRTFRKYNRHDGLQEDIFFIHSVHKNEAGELFFGGINGFNIFHPNKLIDNPHIPKVVLTGFHFLNGSIETDVNSPSQKRIDITKEIVLPYNQTSFGIEFAVLNYRNPEKNQLAYKMTGFDEDFQFANITNNPDAHYKNLDPGKYRFMVKGSNNDGLWNENGASIDIIILSPWWESFFIKVIAFVLIVCFIIGGWNYKTRSIKNRAQQLEMQVAERTKKLETWLESSPVCTKIINLDFNLEYMSSAGINGLQLDDVEKLYGNPYPFDFFPEKYKQKMINDLKKSEDTGETITQEGEVCDIFGNKLWFQATIIPVADDNGQLEYFIVVSVDTTARNLADKALLLAHSELEAKVKERTAELIEAYEHAAKQEKRALLGQVAGKITHDFNNILGIILGNTELALLDSKEPESRKTLELIIEQTMRGRILTKNLVIFAKDQEPKQAFFNVSEKIDLVFNILSKDLEGISIIKENSSEVPDLLADPGMIENALVNLIQNSIHALSMVKNPTITSRSYCSNDNIVIEIEDNGCGIPKENIDNIYDISFTLKGNKNVAGYYKDDIKGTGYGMANVKKYIGLHNGGIKIESELNKGTKIIITLPIIKKELTKEEKTELQNMEMYFEQYILLVEDESSISDVQYSILTNEPCNHIVDTANNGQTALDLLDRNQYDFISLDYILPGDINGMDIYNHIRKTDKTIPILFVSGNIEFLESIKELKQEDDYVDHISKPCLNKDYVNSINKLLEHTS